MDTTEFVAQLRRDKAGRNGPSIYASDRVFGLLDRVEELEARATKLERALEWAGLRLEDFEA